MFLQRRISSAVADPLWHKYLATRSVADRNALVTLYYHSVEAVAHKMITKLRDGVIVDDLISSGSIGLIQAVETFDPSRGFTFLTFAGARIRGAILDGLREIDHATRIDRTLIKRYDTTVETFYAQQGRKPTFDEAISIMRLNDVQIANLKRAFIVVPTAHSLTDVVHESGDGKSMTFEDLVFDRRESPSAEVERKDFIKVLLSRLPVKWSMYISYYFLGGYTMKQIGEQMGLSESRMSQMISGAFKFARREMNLEVA